MLEELGDEEGDVRVKLGGAVTHDEERARRLPRGESLKQAAGVLSAGAVEVVDEHGLRQRGQGVVGRRERRALSRQQRGAEPIFGAVWANANVDRPRTRVGGQRSGGGGRVDEGRDILRRLGVRPLRIHEHDVPGAGIPEARRPTRLLLRARQEKTAQGGYKRHRAID